jgi:hypothetical protein
LKGEELYSLPFKGRVGGGDGEVLGLFLYLGILENANSLINFAFLRYQ